MKLSLTQAIDRAMELRGKGYHCGPSVLQAMWETYEMGNQDFLWAAVALHGGIAGQRQATCGAVAASAVSLGFIHRCSLADKENAKRAREAARKEASELVENVIKKFGAVVCQPLKDKNNCDDCVRFVIEKLYEFEQKRAKPARDAPA